MTTIWAKTALTEGGWRSDVAVTIGAGGRIASVTEGSPPAGQPVGILLPAPVNGHSHAFQRAMAGLTERRGPDGSDSFWTWRRLMYRFLEELTPDHVEAIAAFVQMEMLEAGYAAVAEFHYLHGHGQGGRALTCLSEMAERIVAAAEVSGMGLTLLPVFYQYGGCDRRALEGGQIRFGNDPEGFGRLMEGAREAVAGLPDDARLGVALHSLRAVAPEDIAPTAALADGGPVHMHLAEQAAEVEEVQAAYGQRPVEWLLDHVTVDQRWCLIHCTQMQPEETVALARTGAVAGLCPITESNLGDGIFDGVRWLEAGGRIAIGSDSNIRITLAEELRTLEYSQRLRDRSRAALATAEQSTGRHLFEQACRGGAQAAGRDSGRIAPGVLADLVALDEGAITLAGRSGDALLDSWIFAGDDRLVTDVWSAGRHQVREGRHVAREAITETLSPCDRGALMAAEIRGWQAVQDEVRRRIREGEWPRGEVIPNEADLAQAFGCSRATVNRALQSLADAGLLDRRRKAGTRVALHPVRRATLAIPIIRHEIEGRGHVYGYRLLERRRRPPTADLRADMRLSPRASLLRVKALHLADDRPYVLEDRWISIDAVPAIIDADLDQQSANEWLVANAPFTRGDIAFTASGATRTEAELLTCAPGKALFVIERLTWHDQTAITAARLVFAPGYRMRTVL